MNRRTTLTATVAALTLFGSLFIATAASPGGALTASPALAEEAHSFDALRKAVDARWDRLGFKSELLRVNGVELHVATAGSGPAVVLLHGYPQSGEVWRYIAPELAKAHTVIIPDLRGLGLSEAAKTGYDLSNLSEDIHQLVR